MDRAYSTQQSYRDPDQRIKIRRYKMHQAYGFMAGLNYQPGHSNDQQIKIRLPDRLLNTPDLQMDRAYSTQQCYWDPEQRIKIRRYKMYQAYGFMVGLNCQPGLTNDQ